MRLLPRPALLDVALAAVLTALTLAAVLDRAGGRVDWPTCLLGVLTAAPVALRQRAPVVVTTVVLAAFAATSALGTGYPDGEIPNGGVGILIGVFTVATLRSRPVTAAVAAAALAVTVAHLVAVAAGWSQVAQAVLVVLGAWALGEGTRRWSRHAEQLAARTATAVAQERVRIARELHDVVAHHMAVVAMQAGLAQYVLDTDAATARNAISAAGDAGREALGEMRRLLDVLRFDPADRDDHGLSPQPGVALLDDLLERTRSAGLEVDVDVRGRVRDLPPGVDLCAYRVVQESLTNVLRHAGPARARVVLDYGERDVTVSVTDDGRPSRPRADLRADPRADPRVPADRHGIRGMRERAELYGGTLVAGPAEGGGFAVRARLPVDEPGTGRTP